MAQIVLSYIISFIVGFAHCPYLPNFFVARPVYPLQERAVLLSIYLYRRPCTLERSSGMSIHSLRFRFIIALFIALLLALGVFLSLDLVKKPVVVAQSTIKIMPLGDSITAGVDSSTHGGYRVQLWQDCMSMHWHVQFVGSQLSGPASLPDRQHEGHPGWRIAQISAHVVGWLQTYKPRVVLLQIGTNDIIYHDAVSSAPARLRSLLLLITSTLPGTTVIVAQITPLRDPTLNAQVIAYNRTIPSIVKGLDAQDLPVRYVDMYDAVPVSALEDGIHPNDSGYAAMASVWYQGLRTLLKH
jgi:lysophospholipase L1-like esterase